jgi:hypothetical protein
MWAARDDRQEITMTTFIRSLSLLLLLALTATACDVAPDEPASEDDLDRATEVANEEDALQLTPFKFFGCDQTLADVSAKWPPGFLQIALAMPTWATTSNLCGKTVAYVDGLPAGNMKIVVSGPQAAEGNTWPQSHVLTYTIYGLSKTLCTVCTSQWNVLASGTSVGIAKLNDFNPNDVFIAYPVGSVVVNTAPYSAFRVAATYTDKWGEDHPTKATFSLMP